MLGSETSSKKNLKHLDIENTESIKVNFLEFDLPYMNLLNMEFMDGVFLLW
jgi:hypothetical protein